MSKIVFVDTCIIIDFINGRLNIEQDYSNYCFNSIVDMEILVGVRNKRDLNTTNKKLSVFQNLDIDQDILTLARKLLEKYTLSHGMGIYDAIIAATCLVYDLPLWTHNKKDFQFINKLKLI